ncbi:MAG TPA: DUF4388 domain-containing protein [Candidatus Eisenbacteria bacterium]|jgi:hypothetical protein
MTVDQIYEHSLAAAVHELLAKGLRKLLVTSGVDGEGTTSVTAHVGAAVASTGLESVVLVDAHTLAPRLHRVFDRFDRRGLGDLLEEAYLLDFTREAPDQFGLGDWVEILGAQARTGELRIREGEQSFSIRLVKGSICSVAGGAGDDLLLGDVLVRRGWVTALDLVGALHEQASRRLTRLLALQHAECRFAEMAEPYLAATGGNAPAVPEGEGREMDRA